MSTSFGNAACISSNGCVINIEQDEEYDKESMTAQILRTLAGASSMEDTPSRFEVKVHDGTVTMLNKDNSVDEARDRFREDLIKLAAQKLDIDALFEEAVLELQEGIEPSGVYAKIQLFLKQS